MHNNRVVETKTNDAQKKIFSGIGGSKELNNTFVENFATSMAYVAYIRVFTPLLEEYMKDESFVNAFFDFVGSDVNSLKTSTNHTLFYGETIDKKANNKRGTYLIEFQDVGNGIEILGLLKEPSYANTN
jgi:hypothetical protein